MVLEKSKPDDEINIDENEQQTGSEAEAVEVVIRIEEILTREEVQEIGNVTEEDIEELLTVAHEDLSDKEKQVVFDSVIERKSKQIKAKFQDDT